MTERVVQAIYDDETGELKFRDKTPRAGDAAHAYPTLRRTIAVESGDEGGGDSEGGLAVLVDPGANWEAEVAKAEGDRILVDGGYDANLIVEASTAGTTGTEEPDWSTLLVGDAIEDGTAFWQIVGFVGQPAIGALSDTVRLLAHRDVDEITGVVDGTLEVHGPDDAADVGSVDIRGSNHEEGSNAGRARLLGGRSGELEGAYVEAEGANGNGEGAILRLGSGSAAMGSGNPGGDIEITIGPGDDAGRQGVMRVIGIQQGDPSIGDAIYMDEDAFTALTIADPGTATAEEVATAFNDLLTAVKRAVRVSSAAT